jgi:hypothetical protein
VISRSAVDFPAPQDKATTDGLPPTAAVRRRVSLPRRLDESQIVPKRWESGECRLRVQSGADMAVSNMSAPNVSRTSPITSLAGQWPRGYTLAVALMLGLALVVQLGLYRLGFYRVTADESARSLLALRLSWHNALDPWVWPPFYKIFVGLFLKVHSDVFIVPRILVGIAGLVVLLAMLQLAQTLFADRNVSLITTLLAMPIPDRLIFSVTPMSDIFFYLLLVGASIFILRWLQAGGRWDLIIGCVCLMLASTDRYEACFFAVTLLFYLTGRWLRGHDIGLGLLAAVSTILLTFPVFWAADCYWWYGSLHNLAVTSWQFLGTHGYDYYTALACSPAGSFIYILLWFPLLLLGVVAFCWLALKDRVIRAWAAIFFVPFPLVSAVMIASMSVPSAVPWRTSGAWVFLLLPFTALALVRTSEWLWEVRARTWGLAGLLLVALVPPVIHTAQIVRRGMLDDAMRDWRREREAGLFIMDQLARLGGGKVLIDSTDNLDYLDVMTGSTVPERFVLTSAADPLEVANYMPLRTKYYREADAGIIHKYFADQFDLDRGGSTEALARNDVKLVLARAPGLVHGLEGSALVERLRSFGGWVLYRVRSNAF